MLQDSLESLLWRQWELVDMLAKILVPVTQTPLICKLKRIYVSFVLFCLLRQCFSVKESSCLSWNAFCRPGWP